MGANLCFHNSFSHEVLCNSCCPYVHICSLDDYNGAFRLLTTFAAAAATHLMRPYALNDAACGFLFPFFPCSRPCATWLSCGLRAFRMHLRLFAEDITVFDFRHCINFVLLGRFLQFNKRVDVPLDHFTTFFISVRVAVGNDVRVCGARKRQFHDVHIGAYFFARLAGRPDTKVIVDIVLAPW